MEIKIRKAQTDEVYIAMKLLKEAAEWLREKGIDYWQNWHEPEQMHIKWIQNGFNKGQFFFAIDDQDAVIGMYRLQFQDEIFWGKQQVQAGYIHSFTTKRDHKGQSIGSRMMQMIEETLKDKGILLLRLLCSPAITGLCKYYENHGFVEKGLVTVHGEELRLYEKQV